MYNILFKITFLRIFFINFSLFIYKIIFVFFFTIFSYWNNDDLLHIKCHLKFLFSPWHFLMNKMKIVKGRFITEKFKTIWAMFFIPFFHGKLYGKMKNPYHRFFSFKVFSSLFGYTDLLVITQKTKFSCIWPITMKKCIGHTYVITYYNVIKSS